MRNAAILVILALFVAGCGAKESGPKRYRISGDVTFSGKPVPAGTIYFETTSGPAGSAQIRNGSYDTKSGRGVVGGPHTAIIEGFDGKGANPGEPGRPIFKPQRIDADLPKADTTKNFDIPASAAEGMILSNDPA